MSRLKDLFNRKQKNILNIYFTAGYPHLNDTLPIMRALQAKGVDVIELGMPYSDPLADGEVIQNASAEALKNGMTISLLLEQLKSMRENIHIPVILMGYMNPVMQYGFERFCADAKAVGIDGLILPDLPPYEYETVYGPILKKYQLDFIFLVTPETSEERVKKLDQLSSGFLYAVSSSSTTGKDKDMNLVNNYLQRLSSYELENPLLVGFGIKDKTSFDEAGIHANGAIIGSAFVKALKAYTDPITATNIFIENILNNR